MPEEKDNSGTSSEARLRQYFKFCIKTDKSVYRQGFRKKPETMVQGGKGSVAPQFWSTINFNRPEKGAGFSSPPKYLVPKRLITNP